MPLIVNSHVDNEVHEFVWNIENLQVLSANPNFEDLHVLPFNAGSTIDRVSKWKFFLAPDPDDATETETPSIALFFQLVQYTGTGDITVTLKISIVDDDSQSTYKAVMELRNFTATSTEPIACYFGEFTCSYYTLGKVFQLCDNRPLKMVIKFEIFGENRFSISGVDVPFPASVMARETAESVRRHREDARAMLESGERSDVTFVTRDGCRVPAHRFILSMHSAVFAAMFDAEMKEKTDGVVELVDMGGEALKILLKFVYTAELDDKWGQFYGEIVNAAEKYQITSFTDICEKMLPTLVSWENCADLLKLAELHGMAGAKVQIGNFMKSDPDKLFQLYKSSSQQR